MRKKIFVGVIACSLLLISSACEKGEKTKATGGGNEKDAIIARINNEKITLSEFNERLKDYPALAHAGGNIDLQTKKGFLDNLVVRELLYQDAVKSGLDKEKETASFIEEMKKRVVVERFFKKEVDEKVKVSEEDIKKYYNEHPEEARNPVDVRAAHILVKTKEEADMVKGKLKAGAKFEDMA
ncbi:MAG: SurA N-terminal domain-containing protein, partial [Nitrospira sp.]|nr:SurA N-terminal domain-containing protein [Nitrospira sp.]